MTNNLKLCEAISKETSRIINQAENFELLKDTKSGKAIFAKLYTRDSGKFKCRISLKLTKNVIEVDKLVDESFVGSCIVKLYQCYISIQEIFAKEIDNMKSYFDESDSESENEFDE